MTDIEQLNKAILLAKKAHLGQVDRGNNPYEEHLRAVADGCDSLKEKTVAWLHDIIEDTYVDEEYLLNEGFSNDIVVAVSLLTKVYSEKFDYKAYLTAIRDNPLSCVVKKQDLLNNMDTTRLKRITEKDRAYQEKYKISFEFLEGRPDEDFVFPEAWSFHMDG